MLGLVSSSMQVHGVIWVLSAAGLLMLIDAIRKSNAQFGKIFRFLIPWIGFGLVVIAIPGRFYGRYLMEILIPTILLTVFALSRINVFDKVERNITIIVVGCFLVMGTVVNQLPRMLHVVDDRIISDVKTRSEILAVHPLLLSSGVTVFAWGDPRIPYVANVSSGIKWLNTEPFLTSCEYVTDEIEDELMLELTTLPPTLYFETPARLPLSESCLKDTEIVPFIVKNYEYIETVGDTS